MHSDVRESRGRACAPRAGYLKSLAARLLGGSALVAAALTWPGGPAQAICDQQAADNAIAICSGDTVNQGGGLPGSSSGTNGYGTGTEIGVTVNVLTGASVTGTAEGIFLHTGATIVNDGTITGSDSGVRAATITELTNSGTIRGGTDGVNAITITELTNSGTITSGDFGVNTVTLGNITNTSTGLITGGIFAIIASGGGNPVVDNFGTITGSVILSGVTNTFNNRTGGLFNAGPAVNIGGIGGAGNLLTNAGTFAPGGVGTFQPNTDILGNFTQTPGGVMAVDVLIGVADAEETVVFGTPDIAGLVVPNILDPAAVQPGAQPQVRILRSSGLVPVPVVDNGIAAQDTAVVDYELLFPDALTVLLGATVNFAPSGLNQNQTSVAEAVSAIQAAGGSAGFAPVVGGLLTVPDLASLADAYDQLGPEIYLDNAIATLFSTLSFTDDLMSCEVREGGNVFINEGQCIWAKGSGSWFDQDATSQTIGFERDAIRFAAGGQVAIAPDWRLGMSIGYENSGLDALGGRQSSDADALHGGAVIKYLIGDGLIAAAISGGQGWYDTTRTLAFGGFVGQSTADHDVNHLTGRLRGAYAFTNGAHYIKPMVDLNISHIDIDGFTERGGNGAALIVNGTDETVFSVSPAVEFGWQSQTQDGVLLRPYIRAGVTVFDDPELVVTSRFAAAPAGAPSFRTKVETDDVVADLAAGLDVLTNDGTVLKVYYAGQFGEDTTQQSVGARASLPF